jgi:hypothetical protein
VRRSRGAVWRPWALLLPLAFTGCGAADDAVTDYAPTIDEHKCAGRVLAVGASHPVVSCEDGAVQLLAGQWTLASKGQVTAVLEPWPGSDGYTRFVTRSGKFGVLLRGRPHDFIDMPTLRVPAEGPAYSWRPPGLEDVAATVYTGLYRTGDDQFFAVTAGAGAAISDDAGATWRRSVHWNPRFQLLDGSRPLEIDSLLLSEEGRIAFILHPEGREISAETLAKLDDEGEEDTTTGGPRLAVGTLNGPGMQVRAVPTAVKHFLGIAPGQAPRGLWMYATHPDRNETTRFQSHDWGRTWLDTGYYDFTTRQAISSRRRIALLGTDDRGRSIAWIQGDGPRARFADIGELPEGDFLAAMDDVEVPQRLVVAGRGSAVALDLSDVGPDVRLFWYYIPAAFVVLIGFPLAVRRFVHNVRRAREAKA